MSDFNRIADQYDDIVNDSLPQGSGLFRGADHAYFNDYKMQYLRPLFAQQEMESGRALKVLDYGCGVGIFSGLLVQRMPDATVHGFDISEQSIADVPAPLKEYPRTRFTSNLLDLDEDYDVALLITVSA